MHGAPAYHAIVMGPVPTMPGATAVVHRTHRNARIARIYTRIYTTVHQARIVYLVLLHSRHVRSSDCKSVVFVSVLSSHVF